MKKSFVQILKEVWEEKKKFFENYRFYCQKIKREAENFLGPCRVLVFGSIVKGKFTPRSDIDVLIISEKLPESQKERGEIRTKIKSTIGSFSPFQIHLATPKEYESWYQKFIKDDYEETD
jgi:hypothetical protein